ncbi:MAG: carbohydrate ABC transporter permease [Myxococcales bacterium]
MFETLRDRGLSYLIVGPFAIVLAFPFYWMLVTMFKTNGDLYNLENVPFTYHKSDPALGEKLNFEHYDWLPFGFQHATASHVGFIFHDTNYGQWLVNTAIVGGLVVLITLLLAVPAGYSLARLSGGWGQSVGVGIFLTYLVPPTILVIPLSRVVASLGLQDSLWALILVYPSFTVPFCTWLMMGFFKVIPKDIEEAAMMDGLSRFGAFVRVILPMSIAGLLTVVIFAFTLVLQEFVYGVTFITSARNFTISVGVPTFLVRGDVYFWGSLMAACFIASVPIAFLYNLFVDRFISGFTVGAVKG